MLKFIQKTYKSIALGTTKPFFPLLRMFSWALKLDTVCGPAEAVELLTIKMDQIFIVAALSISAHKCV